jgi:large subunit ribosomal protein L15
MVVRREKKIRKCRGHRSYGYGFHKKHRGKGSRGGRGQAGKHKHKWSYVQSYEPEHFGKYGFKRTYAEHRRPKSINLEQIDAIAAASGKKEIDLKEMGFDKVLGSGRISKPLVVKAKIFSKNAVKKIEAAGGKVVKPEAEKKEKAKE